MPVKKAPVHTRASGFQAAVLVAAVYAFIPWAYAEEKEEPTVIRVESSAIDDRTAAKEGEPSAVAVISGEEVDRAHGENIQQLLKTIPGITTEIQSGDSIKIHLRGVENQRYMGEKPGVAVVIDGVPVFERTGRVNIDLDNIESVKVIKGGASYLFGEDALSGAVIITTKRGAKMGGYQLGVEAGSFGYVKELARAGYSGEKTNMHIQASGRKSDGYHDQSGYQANYVDGKLQYFLSGQSDVTFGFENSARKKDSHGTVLGVTQAKNDPKSQSPDAGRDYARKYDVALGKYYLTYTNDMGQADSLQLNVYHFGDDTAFLSAPQYFDAKGNPVSNADAYTTKNDYHQVQRGVKGEWRSGGEAVAYMAGVDARANEYNNKTNYMVDFKQAAKSPTVFKAGTVTGDNKTAETVGAAYGEVKIDAGSRTALTANARYDQIKLDFTDHLNKLKLDKTFNVYSWRAGANHKMTESWDAYASVSTGFRAPTVEQLFSGSISPTGSVESNPGLKPEQSINYEVGARGKAAMGGVGMELDLAVFQIDRKDFILNAAGQYSIPENGTKDRYENIGGVRNQGVELSARTDPSRPVSLDLAYTYLDAKFTKYDNFNMILGNRYVKPTIVHYDNTGKKVPRTPDHHLNLTGRITPLEGLSIAAEMDAISSYYADETNMVRIDGHQTYNLLATYDFAWGRGKWSLFARVDNITDKRYYTTARGSADSNGDKTFNAEDISITVNPGRVLTAGLSGSF